MGASLDSLEVKISADASKAARSLTELKTALSGLNTALAPAAKGLDSMVLSLSKVVGMQSGLTNISKTFGSLAKSWTALNQSTNKSAAEMASISDKARTMSQAFAKEYGIKGKESVNELTNAFHKLYSSVGDNVAMGKALHSIETLIRDLGRVKAEANEVEIAIKNALSGNTVKLEKDVTKDLGSSLINYMSKLSHVSATQGTLPSDIVKELNASLDKDRVLGSDKDYSAGFIDITGMTNEAEILKLLVDTLREAESQTISFKEAANQDQEVINLLNQKLENLASSVGTTMKGAMESYLNAMHQMYEISPSLVEQLNAVDNSIENISDNGNPFEGVLSGLSQLANIDLPASLNNITAVKDAMGKLGGENAARAAANLPGIATALKQLDGVTIPPIGEDAMNLADGLSKLGKKKIADGFTNLENIKASLMGINNLKIDPAVTQSIYQLADGLYKFGLAKMDKAVSTIPALAGSITQLVNSLSTLPAVSDNTIRLISALGNVNVHANTAANTMGGRLSRGLKLYTGNAFNARKASMSLAQAFGKMYANFFIFFRLARQFKNDIDLASDLTEVQNVVDVTFGNMADKMNDFAKSAIDSLGMSELTAKRVGSRFQAMGTAMDISDSMVKSTNDFVQKATNGYADVADSIADVSINLTRLAGDMASFYNADYADVAEDLEAIYTGLSKPLRKYGIDLSQASLSAWALNHGMEANFKTMTQAEKTLLRYQYVMAQSTAAHKDFERTQTTWANSVRIATERLNQLRIVLGKIAIYTFKPLVQSFNKAMEQIIKGAEGLLNSLGKIFGWQIEWNDGGILNEEADDSEELADNMGDAADNAKKFKNFLLGIDELNVLPSNDDKDKGKGSGLGDLGGLGDATGGFNIRPVEKGFDSIYDTLFKLGARINEIIKELLQKIDWDKVYKKARAFGTGLADFLNGLLLDSETFYEIGKFFANGINTVAHAIDAFHKRFDGFQFGLDIGNAINGFIENLDWDVIKSAVIGKAHDLAETINGAFITIKWKDVGKTIAEGLNTAIEYFFTLADEIKWTVIGTSIANAINGFFANFDFVKAAKTLNVWAKGLLDAIITALDKTDWEKVGESIGEFVKEIDFISIASKVVAAFWKALDGMFSTYGGILTTAPIETSISTAVITAFSSRKLRKEVLKGVRKHVTAISEDIANLFNGKTLNTFMNGFIGADSRGIIKEAGTAFGNLKNGVNAVSASLNTATKAVGGLAVAFGEFFMVKNSVSDIAEAIAGNSDKDIAGSITKLIGVVGLASAAFSLLLGIPAGLIIAGATAAAAAVFGISEALRKVSEDKAISAMTRDLGEAGTTLEELSVDYKKSTDNMTSRLTELTKDADKLSDMRDDLSGMLDGLKLIGDTAGTNASIMGSALSELVGNIGEIKSAWEDYIEAQYDYLIKSTLNNYDFIKSQGEVTEEEKKYYTDKIAALYKAKTNDIETASAALEDLTEKAEAYNEALANSNAYDDKGFKILTEDVYETEVALEDAVRNVLNLELAVGGINTGGLPELNEQMNQLASDTDYFVLSLKNIDASDFDSIATAVTSYEGQIQDFYTESKQAIDSYKQGLIDNGYTEEQAIRETQAFYDYLYKETETNLEKAQTGLYKKIYAVMATGDSEAAWNVADKIITPFVDAFPMVIDKEGNALKPKIKEAVNGLYSEAFDWRADSLMPTLKKDWITSFYKFGSEVSPEMKQLGERMIGNVSEGISDASKTAATSTTSLEKLAGGMKETDKASGAATTSIKDFTNFTQKLDDVSKETAKGVKDLNTVIKDMSKNNGGGFGLQAMAGLQAQSGLALSGVTNVKEELEKTVTAGKGIEEVSNNFGMLGTVFTNLMTVFVPVKQGFDSFTTETQLNMQKTTSIFGESFTSIMKYGNQTISWLKGSFVPYFSGAYWNGITSSIPNAFGNAFKQAINIMMNLWKQFATWANQNMKMKVNMRGKEVTGVDVEIPQYATGGFPDEDGLFQANHGEMVGQFANGKTAVANNEQIVEGIRQGVYDAVKAAMAENGSGNVTVELAGDASDIFTAVVKENNRAIYRTGTSPIRN